MKWHRIYIGVVLIGIFFSTIGRCQNWQSVSDEIISGSVYSLYHDTLEGALFVGGDFQGIGGNNSQRSIAMWRGNQWYSLENGLNSYQWPASIRGIIRYNDEIYVCGAITDADGLVCNGIAKWDGFQWSSVGEGLLDYDDNPAFTFNLRVIQGELYACGQIFSAGNITANGIAKWNGTSWSDVHEFPFFDENGDVITDCIIYNDELYVCGSFYAGSGTGMLGIAKWNGSNWVGVGPIGVGQASCMAVYNGKLFVGGYFSSVMNPALPGNYIASWDGSTWDNVGGGVGNSNGNVYEMVTHEGKLYVAGAFTSVGGIPAQFIATWDGDEWCDLGSTSNNVVLAIEEFNDTLYIGGGFTELNGNPIFSVAKSGGAAQDENCGTLSGIEEAETNANGLVIYPNPTTSTTTLTWQAQNHSNNYQLQLYDGQGKLIFTETLRAAQGSKVLDMSAFSKGIYFGRLLVGEEDRPFGSAQGKSFKVVRE